MELFYTTLVKNTDQKKPEYSLGGYKSLSRVQNLIGNLFSNISVLSEERLLNEYIALVLYNNSGNIVENISLWFEYPKDTLGNETNICKFEISAVALDSTGRMENVENVNSKPFNVEFYEANGEENSVGLDSLENESGIGLWIKRSILQDRVLLKKDNDTLNSNYLNKVIPIQLEDINLKIDWVSSYYGGGLGDQNL